MTMWAYCFQSFRGMSDKIEGENMAKSIERE